jgi:thioester reductase-like protein
VPNAKKQNKIFITGSTGFLGSFLLKELLQSHRQVYCLVRAADSLQAMQRLQNSLSFFNLWQEAYRTAIVPVLRRDFEFNI